MFAVVEVVFININATVWWRKTENTLLKIIVAMSLLFSHQVESNTLGPQASAAIKTTKAPTSPFPYSEDKEHTTWS